MEEIEDLNNELAKITEQWAVKYISNRIAYLKKRGVVASGDLVGSFGQDVQANVSGVAVQSLIAFADQGRFIDMKRYSHDKWGRNAAARLSEWIKRKGVEKFVPGFLNKYKRKSPPPDVINRIAWGIMVSRSNNKFRRRPWYAKSSAGAVSDLYNQIATANSKTTLINLKEYAERKGRQ